MPRYTLSSVDLVFFNQYRQLCVYDTVSSSNNILATFVLLSTVGSVKRYTRISKDGSELVLDCLQNRPTLPSGTSWSTSTPYQFDKDAGQIWYDSNNPASIVVGIGDIRDGITAKVFWYPIPENTIDPTNPSYLLVECTNPFNIRFHYTTLTPLNESVSDDTIVCP